MAILRDPINSDNSVNYVATLAFFCCVSCVTLMLKFGGFKASLKLFGGKQKSNGKYKETNSDVFVTGAYRTNRDEFFGTERASDPPRKLTPSIVKLPKSQQSAPVAPLRTVKSTGNINNEETTTIRAAASVSLDPRGDDTNSRVENVKKTNAGREDKKLKKQRLAQEKARQKQEAQELAKQEKLRKDQEKKEAQHVRRLKKKKAPQPLFEGQSRGGHNETAEQAQSSIPLGKAPVRYSTNTLESSISRSSGPPPYSEVPKEQQSNASSDVTFSKPIDTGSWDMISRHRQQLDRPMQTGSLKEKRMVMDLNYNFNSNLSIRDDKQNSEA